MKRTVFAVVAGSMLFLAGCAGSDDSSGVGGSSGGSGSAMSSVDAGAAVPGIAMAPESGADVARDQAPVPAERKEVVTGQIAITADDPIAAARDTVALVEAADGRVDNRTETPESGDIPASSSLTVRIPADKLSGTLDGIRELGDVTNMSMSRDDVTLQYQDLDARIAALQASVDRLQVLISNASNTADLIAAESALSSRQGELDSLRAQQKYLSDQVELSTFTVQFDTESVTPGEPGADSFWDGLVSGWNALVSFAAGALVVVGALVPWVAVVAAIALVVYSAVRANRTRQASRQARRSQVSADIAGPESK